MAKKTEILKYQKELLQVKELFKLDAKMTKCLKDGNIIRIIHLLEKWRKQNDLNGYMEAWRVTKNKSYWIAYSLLTDEEIESLHSYQYRNIVHNFINTIVLKAKKTGKLNDCCESIRKHRVHENKIFIDLIKKSAELTEKEKSEILNLDKLTESQNYDDHQILSDAVEYYYSSDLAGIFKNFKEYDLDFCICQVEVTRKIGDDINELLEYTRVMRYNFEEPAPCSYPLPKQADEDVMVQCYTLSEKELDEYINYAYESYLADALSAKAILANKNVSFIKRLLESEEKEFESLMKEINIKPSEKAGA